MDWDFLRRVEDDVIESFAEDPTTPASDLQDIAEYVLTWGDSRDTRDRGDTEALVPGHVILSAVASNANAGLETLELLADCACEVVRLNVVEHPDASRLLVERIIRYARETGADNEEFNAQLEDALSSK